MPVLNIVLDEKNTTRLREHAATTGLKMSEIVRRALTAHFAAIPVKPPRPVAAKSQGKAGGA